MPSAKTMASKYEQHFIFVQHKLKIHGIMNTIISGNITFFKKATTGNSFDMLCNAINCVNMLAIEKNISTYKKEVMGAPNL